MRLVRNENPITHLFFADDLLLLVEATCDQARVICSVLDVFCSGSGAKVNKDKTQFFSSRMSKLMRLNKQVICSVFLQQMIQELILECPSCILRSPSILTKVLLTRSSDGYLVGMPLIIFSRQSHSCPVSAAGYSYLCNANTKFAYQC